MSVGYSSENLIDEFYASRTYWENNAILRVLSGIFVISSALSCLFYVLLSQNLTKNK